MTGRGALTGEGRPAARREFRSFADELRRSAQVCPGAPAVEFGDECLSYQELFDRACRLANGLQGLGVRRGGGVATLTTNSLESAEQICAIALLGAVRIPLYAHNPASLHAHMLTVSRAVALITETAFWADIEPFRDHLPDLSVIVVRGKSDECDYVGLVEGSQNIDPHIPSAPEDVAIIRFSSGTTGKPKGIMHRQANYHALGEAMARTLEHISSESVQIVAGPMSHVSGAFFWPVISRGAKQIIMAKFEPEQFVRHIEGGATFSLVVPTMLRSVLDLPGLNQRRLDSLTRLGYGGASIDSTTLQRALDVFGPILTQSYGQSEVTPISVLTSRMHDLNAPDFDPSVLRSAGRIVEGADVRIVDDEGREVEPGRIGELAVKAPWAMSEIWGDQEATRARFLADGYLLTRDMGYLDGDILFLADRKDDMIISGGYNIWPKELEDALMTHPSVSEVAVVGVPHPHWGETPVAVVVFRQGHNVAEPDLISWCRDRVGGVKKPSRILIRTALPRNDQGKVLRRVLREELRAAMPDEEKLE